MGRIAVVFCAGKAGTAVGHLTASDFQECGAVARSDARCIEVVAEFPVGNSNVHALDRVLGDHAFEELAADRWKYRVGEDRIDHPAATF